MQALHPPLQSPAERSLRRRYCTFPCIADEHFIPSLLAHLQLEEETDCLGYLTYNTWDPARIELMSLEQHKPVDFKPEFVDKDMFYGMRRAHCIANPHAAMVRAGTMFTGPFHQARNTSTLHCAVEPCFNHLNSL